MKTTRNKPPQALRPVQQAFERLAPRGPTLQPMTLEETLAHPVWWLVLHRAAQNRLGRI